MTMIFKVEKMNCGGCARKVAEAIRKVDSDAYVQVDLEKKTVEVASDEVGEAVLAAALIQAGYPSRAVH